jgi:uncharacterized protein
LRVDPVGWVVRVGRDEFAQPGQRSVPMVVIMGMVVIVIVVMLAFRRTGHAPIMPVGGAVCDCWCMHVASLHIYPVKGCHRIDVDRAELQPWGFAGDRRWLIVDEDGVAVTIRDVPSMTGIQPVLTDGGLVLRATGHADLAVAEPAGAELSVVKVWGFIGKAALAGPVADRWLSAVLERSVRLVWLDDPTRRPVDPEYGTAEDRVSFADGYPVLLGNLASLRDLNDRIAESASREGPLPMPRFRPNIVIEGARAWVEDAWTGGRMRIGEVTFRVVKPCERCVVTTTDQETGEKGKEPLRTLARFRNVNQGLLFATNLIPDNVGTINVGDDVAPA